MSPHHTDRATNDAGPATPRRDERPLDDPTPSGGHSGAAKFGPAGRDAGNLVDDGTFVYFCDACNRLVLVRSSVDADVTIQTAEFDGVGRRLKKVVTGSGDSDGTTVYLYEGQKICDA